MSRLQSMLVAVKQRPRSTMSTFSTWHVCFRYGGRFFNFLGLHWNLIINYEKDTAHLSNGGSLPSLSWLRVVGSPGNRLVIFGGVILVAMIGGSFSGHVWGEF